MTNGEQAAAGQGDPVDNKNMFVAFRNLQRDAAKLRDLRSERIGQLVRCRGTVTRTTDVRPELISATFLCLKCGLEAPDVEQQLRYTTPTICRNQGHTRVLPWIFNVFFFSDHVRRKT